MPRLVFSQPGNISLQSISQLVSTISPCIKPVVINNSFAGCADVDAASIIGIGGRLSVDISELMNDHPTLFESQCIIRNYIEPGSIFVTDNWDLSLGSYAVIGDTHHIKGAIRHAYRQLEAYPPLAIISLANPLHLGLWGKLNCPLLTYPWHSYIDNHTTRNLVTSPERKNSRLSICASLTHVQNRRSMYIKQLLSSPNLNRIDFFVRQKDIDKYLDRLLLSSFCLVPSLNYQVSPQIYFSLRANSFPLVECRDQLVYSKSDIMLSHFCLDSYSLMELVTLEDEEADLLYYSYLEKWKRYLHTLATNEFTGEYGFFCEGFFELKSYSQYSYTGPLSTGGTESIAIAKYFDLWLARDDSWKYYSDDPGISFFGENFFRFYESHIGKYKVIDQSF